MKSRTLIILLGLVLLLSSCKTAQQNKSALFPDWQPNIDQPLGQLEATLAELEQQQPRNYTISNVSFLYDAKLYILFYDFLARLPETSRASQIAEQQKWLKKRKKLIHAGYAEYEGGTLAAYTAGQASIAATKERITEIENEIKDF